MVGTGNKRAMPGVRAWSGRVMQVGCQHVTGTSEGCVIMARKRRVCAVGVSMGFSCGKSRPDGSRKGVVDGIVPATRRRDDHGYGRGHC